MKHSIIYLCFMSISFCFGQQYLVKLVPTESRDDRGRGYFYQDAVPLETAEMLHKYFVNRRRLGRIPTFYAVPNTRLFMAAASVDADSGGIGLSFFKVRGDSATEIVTSSGGGLGSVIPRVAFFCDDDRILVLAEYGSDDYDYGFFAAECRHDSARILTIADISIQTPEGGYGSAIDNVRARFANGTYYLEFTANVIIDPGGKDYVVRLPKSGKLTFVYDGKAFVRSR